MIWYFHVTIIESTAVASQYPGITMYSTRTSLPYFLLIPALTCLSPAWAIDDISIVGLFRDRAVIEFNGKQLLLLKGSTSPEGVTLISANSSEAIIEYNGTRKTYQLGSRIENTFAQPLSKNAVVVAPDGTGMYVVNGSINGFQTSFVIDTGATLVSMNENHARRFGIDYKLTGKRALSSTASGLDEIYLVELAHVMVGDLEAVNIMGAVHSGEFPQVILLGNSFLGKVHMEREGRLLRLEQLY